MKRTPRVAAIHDLSGFGRCSLTIVMPVLSAMGIQCCPLPTAYLSTHTGGFTGNTFLDMTNELEKAMAHWEGLGLISRTRIYLMPTTSPKPTTAPECEVFIETGELTFA